jgi:hypothetical protein
MVVVASMCTLIVVGQIPVADGSTKMLAFRPCLALPREGFELGFIAILSRL